MNDEQKKRYQELIAAGYPPELAVYEIQVEFGLPAPPDPPGGAPVGVNSVAEGAAQPPTPSAMLPPGGEAGQAPMGQFGNLFSFGQDPFTGAAQDVPSHLRSLSDTRGERFGLFQEGLDRSPAFGSSSPQMQDYIEGRFNPLDARFQAEGLLDLMGREQVDPWGGDSPDFASFLSDNPREFSGDQWSDVFGQVRGLADRVPGIEQETTMSGPDQAAYGVLREGGRGIMDQAILANVHPAVVSATARVLARNFAEWGSAERGSPQNQAEYLRQQAPMWEDILAVR